MKSILKILLGIVEIAVIIFAIFMVSVIFMRNDFGYTQYGKNTLIIVDDYNTTELQHFTSGDLVIVENKLYSEINVGDEVYYYDTLNDTYIVKYGIVKTKTGDNRSALYTFEENEKVTISSDRILGVYKTSHANLGKVLGFLQSTVGFLIFVILPILVLFIYQIYNLVIILKYDKE
jgi:hypothetical protein